jgi:hypothetical protein
LRHRATSTARPLSSTAKKCKVLVGSVAARRLAAVLLPSSFWVVLQPVGMPLLLLPGSFWVVFPAQAKNTLKKQSTTKRKHRCQCCTGGTWAHSHVFPFNSIHMQADIMISPALPKKNK